MSPTPAGVTRQAAATDTRNEVAIYGSPVGGSVSPPIFNHLFRSLGLPHHFYDRVECPTLNDKEAAWHRLVREPSCLGTCLTMPLKFEVIPFLDGLSPEALALGSVNTTYFAPSPSGSTPLHLGHNTDQSGLYNLLRSTLTSITSPFPPSTPSTFSSSSQSAGMMVGGGGAARAAVWALSRLGLSPIFLVNRDESETAALVAQFPQLDLRALGTVAVAERELGELKGRGGSVVVAIGAIPSVEPRTWEEKKMYEVLKKVLGERYEAPAEEESGGGPHFQKPRRRVFCEMAYKPHWTIVRSLARDADWDTLCGVDVVLEVCFDQLKVWTGIEASRELREETRKFAWGEGGDAKL